MRSLLSPHMVLSYSISTSGGSRNYFRVTTKKFKLLHFFYYYFLKKNEIRNYFY